MNEYTIEISDHVGHDMYKLVGTVKTGHSILRHHVEEGLFGKLATLALLMCQTAYPDEEEWLPYLTSNHPEDEEINWPFNKPGLWYGGIIIDRDKASELLNGPEEG